MLKFEVIANGFDANTDSTDDRVLWVACENIKDLENASSGTNAKFKAFDFPISDKECDYFLPIDNVPLNQLLKSFEGV
jgi:hypothetical protein